MDYSQIAYAKINLDYDHKLFAEEYDNFILPNANPICNMESSNEETASLNVKWNMVPDDIYTKIMGFSYVGEDKTLVRNDNPYKTWQMEQLMYIHASKLDARLKKISKFGTFGGTTLRNLKYNENWFIKPQYKNLEIVKFIQSLPFEKIVFMHCVSLEPGQFASIHRDTKGTGLAGDHTNMYNEIAKAGYVVLVLNISSGGAPLYWSLDGDDRNTPFKVDDPAYIISDYFLHGVPQVTGRRRQIRVTGKPSKEFAELLAQTGMVTISDGYKFNYSLMS
jgi:hypothetical protein